MRKAAMNRWLAVAVVAACVFGAPALAQEQKAKPYVPRKIVLSPQPVTRDEAKKVFDKMNASLQRIVPGQQAVVSNLIGSQPVNRGEVIDHFHRLFEIAKPAFTYTPKRVTFDPGLLTVKAPESRTRLESLIAWGCVDRVGPLATSNKDTLGVLEFGDAVGFLLARLAQLSHYPDPRYTPELQP